jgi:hypothetical protein
MDITNLLNIAGYLALFIICFINLFKSPNETMSLLLLIIFHTFLIIFTVIFKFRNGDLFTDVINSTIWWGMFIGNIFSFTTITLVLITYNHLYNQYKLKNDDIVPLSHFYKEYMNKFKIMYVTSISIILLILLLLNLPIINIYIKLLLGIFITVLLAISSYGIYIGHIILKLNNKTAINLNR